MADDVVVPERFLREAISIVAAKFSCLQRIDPDIKRAFDWKPDDLVTETALRLAVEDQRDAALRERDALPCVICGEMRMALEEGWCNPCRTVSHQRYMETHNQQLVKIFDLESQRNALLDALREYQYQAESWHNFHHGCEHVKCDAICAAIPAGRAAIASVGGA